MKLFISTTIITILIISGIGTMSASTAMTSDSCLESLFSESSNANDNCIDTLFGENTDESTDTLLDGLFDPTSSDIDTEDLFNDIFNSAPSDDIDSLFDELFGSTEPIVNLPIVNPPVVNLPVINNYVYTSWELAHRTPMLQGFMWAGDIAKFISPQMYVGTPLANQGPTPGNNNSYYPSLIAIPSTYAECIEHEAYLSFGLGNLIEQTHIKELKAIAKACAKEHYGSYFNGKSYTTREEFLMMLFTMFEEQDVGFQGKFRDNGMYMKSKNDDSMTGYANVDTRAWYASYLKLARHLSIVSGTTTWKVAQQITDTEAIEILSLYTAYRMNFEGDMLDRGIIVTQKMKYTITFPSEREISIHIQ